ncbi:MAG: ARMT1-like domain-containing protein [Ruminococcus sp.]|nr:ARMT1-like domain-containing protein [Ruminococcus sp.]
MRLYASCMCCLLEKQELKIRKCTDEAKKAEYLKELMRLIGNSGEEANAPWLASEISKIYEKHFHEKDDFGPAKRKFNQFVMQMEQVLEQKLMTQPDPLKAAMLYARVGNYIDFSAVEQISTEEFLSLFEREHDKIDEMEYINFCAELSQAKHMVYLLDNCGEIVLDKLLIRLLQVLYPNLKITAVVRGGEVVNDATMEDARMTGLTEIVDVIGNGDDVAGTILSRVSPECLQIIEQADVILAKGQGNFESLHGCGKNVYYLFLCKCDWFMRKFQVERFQGMFVNERRIPYFVDGSQH